MRFVVAVMVVFMLLNVCLYADETYSYQFRVFEKNTNGNLILQKSTDYNKKNPCCYVSIKGSNKGEYTNKNGIAKIELPARYSAGTEAYIKVIKQGRHIVFPKNSTVILPNDITQYIDIILEPLAKKSVIKEYDLTTPKRLLFHYVVKVFTTKYPEKANEIVFSLKNKGFPAYEIKSITPRSDKFEFESSIVVGKFYNKNKAKGTLRRLRKNTGYKKMFIQKIYE